MIALLALAAFVASASGCGQRPSFQGVVAGQTAQPHSWPWQIQLTRGRHFCGGSLISPHWVVTAAHCVVQNGRPTSARGLTIRLGGHRQSGNEQGVQHIPAAQIIVHERYRSLNNDVALIRLSRPAQITKSVSTICLPQQGQRAPAGGTCYITGWGRTRGGGQSASVLQQAMMPIISDRDCQSAMSRIGRYDTTSMVCAGIKGSPVSGCQGDSGGPFVCNEGGKWVLRGAVSWGNANCQAGRTFTAFARISTFASWIAQKTGGGGGGGGPNPPNPNPNPNPPPTCSDKRQDCRRYARYCRYNKRVRYYCPKTCRVC